MSLTATQTAFLSEFDSNIAVYRSDLEASMEADNDPASTTLENAVILADNLRKSFAMVAVNLGYHLGPPQYNTEGAVQCALPAFQLTYRTGAYPSFSSHAVYREDQHTGENIFAYRLPILARYNTAPY